MKVTRVAARLLVAALAVGSSAFTPSVRAAPQGGLPEPVPCDGCYVPGPDVTWQYQLSSAPDPGRPYDLWIVDGFDTDVSLISEMHATGGKVGCYLSAGSWEDWRPDADDFPEEVLGRGLEGWPGERWLDIRQIDLLAPIMSARMDMCVSKGFDLVDFDNVNGFVNRTGFPLRARHQLAYNAWLANAAHERGLAVALKNEGEQAEQLEPHFDTVVVEQCFLYRECGLYRPFLDSGKAVLAIEYELARSEFCARAERLSINAVRKRFALGPWIRRCP